VLRQLSDTLVELHGQQDDRGLLNPRGHRRCSTPLRGRALPPTRAPPGARAARARRWPRRPRHALAEMRAEEDFLRHAVAELTRSTRSRARRGARRPPPADAGRRAIARTSPRRMPRWAPRAPRAPLGDALRWLEGVAEQAEGRLDGAIDALGRALTELGEAEQGVGALPRGARLRPAELEAAEERLFAIRGWPASTACCPTIWAGSPKSCAAVLPRSTAGGDIAALERPARRRGGL
jgi:DNA repair protein RecN (Recombination protein N)